MLQVSLACRLLKYRNSQENLSVLSLPITRLSALPAAGVSQAKQAKKPHHQLNVLGERRIHRQAWVEHARKFKMTSPFTGGLQIWDYGKREDAVECSQVHHCLCENIRLHCRNVDVTDAVNPVTAIT